jgi:hypothetical protein
MTPFDAPAFYRFTTSAPVLLRNVAQYADRTMTFSAGLLLLALFVLRPRFRNLDGITQRIVACGFVWLAVFLLPASVLPVRSSLYACLPSVGVSVAAAAIVGHWWSRAPDRRRQRALICAVLLPVLVWPIYLARAQRWVRMAEFSTQALSELQSAASALPDNSGILIIDDRTVRANVASVFSTVLRDSFLLTSGRYMTFYVRPPVDNADPQNGGAAACGGCVDVTLVVKDGRLTRQ